MERVKRKSNKFSAFTREFPHIENFPIFLSSHFVISSKVSNSLDEIKSVSFIQKYRKKISYTRWGKWMVEILLREFVDLNWWKVALLCKFYFIFLQSKKKIFADVMKNAKIQLKFRVYRKIIFQKFKFSLTSSAWIMHEYHLDIQW